MKLFRACPKKGDTLIEVTLAVGIFSMVAVAVVSVVSTSTSNGQIALETTLAREQIDAQAEALRFIHSSAVSALEEGKKTDKFVKLWEEIKKNANTSNANGVLEYSPNTCAELYSGGGEPLVKKQQAFIIDTHSFNESDIKKIYISAKTAPANTFTATSTYPRLFYNGDLNDNLVTQGTGNTFYHAEGIFIVAVKDSNSTYIVENGTVKPGYAYYDFYIHSCWYGPGARRPSTISTVVRLHDPERT